MNEYLCLIVCIDADLDNGVARSLRKVRIIAGSIFEAALKVSTKEYEDVWQITYLGEAILAKESKIEEISESSRVWSWGEEGET